ncbi:MAG: extracellular solute-binding protein [Clostridia bacterium]|nr:extracellular solute-binding protein [Clostridia bacterium]
MKNFFIKLVLCVLIATLMIGFAGCSSSSSTAAANSITVFSWEDYIDEDLLTEFEEETGIKVNYYTFATNEEMYNELIKDPSACDLICPSEYMIMKMVGEDLVQKYDTPASYETYGSEYIKSVFDSIECGDGHLSDYAIGYMWGTMGYIYNSDKVTNEEDLINWDGIINDEYKGKSTIKDSVRDTYIMALAMVYKDELLEYKDQLENGEITDSEYNEILTEVFNRTDDESIAKVKDVLIKLKSYLYSFEVDSGKSDLLTGKIDINFAWSGDAVYVLDLGDEAGINLSYVVPEEGSNVWFDGWVIPKASKKVEQARNFLDFISLPENAVRNMDIIGYTACVAGDEVFDNAKDWYGACTLVLDSSMTEADYNALTEEEKEGYELDKNGNVWVYEFADDEGLISGDDDNGYTATLRYFDDESGETYEEEVELYKVDLKYFFDPTCTDDTYVIYSEEEGRQLYAQYSDEETINRCVVMQNFDKDTLKKINDMWNDVKLISLPTYAIILIAVAIVGAVAAVVVLKLKKPEFLRVKKEDKK